MPKSVDDATTKYGSKGPSVMPLFFFLEYQREGIDDCFDFESKFIYHRQNEMRPYLL